MTMQIERAAADDARTLTEIAFAAKRHWQYPETWIRRWENVLTITPEYIVRHPTFVAAIDGESAGFCALRIEASEAWLDHLWVRPSFMRRGVGRALFRRAEAFARAAGAKRLKIVGAPPRRAILRPNGRDRLRSTARQHGRNRAIPSPAREAAMSVIGLSRPLPPRLRNSCAAGYGRCVPADRIRQARNRRSLPGNRSHYCASSLEGARVELDDKLRATARKVSLLAPELRLLFLTNFLSTIFCYPRGHTV